MHYPVRKNNEDDRRRILTRLNRGENRHAAASVICQGQKGEFREHYQDRQEAQQGILERTPNAVVLWNNRC